MKITKMNVLLNDDYSVVLVREHSTNYKDIGEVKNPKVVVQVMRDVFKIHKQAEEYLFLVSMTKKCRPIGFFEISHGTHDATLMGMREIFIRALMSGAANIIIAHNYPSGNCEPSQMDILITREIEKASKLMGWNFMTIS